jgi:hypothetical protein
MQSNVFASRQKDQSMQNLVPMGDCEVKTDQRVVSSKSRRFGSKRHTPHLRLRLRLRLKQGAQAQSGSEVLVKFTRI